MNNTVISTLALVFFLTVASRITFRNTDIGRRFNMAEYFYALTYVACLNMIATFLLLPFRVFANVTTDRTTINFLILWWVCSQLYQIKKLKAFLLTIQMMLIVLLEIVLVVAIVIAILVLAGVINVTD